MSRKRIKPHIAAENAVRSCAMSGAGLSVCNLLKALNKYSL